MLFHLHKHACHVPLNSFKDALNGLRPAFEKQRFRYNHFSNCLIDSNGVQCLFQFCSLGLMPPNCIPLSLCLSLFLSLSFCHTQTHTELSFSGHHVNKRLLFLNKIFELCVIDLLILGLFVNSRFVNLLILTNRFVNST